MSNGNPPADYFSSYGDSDGTVGQRKSFKDSFKRKSASDRGYKAHVVDYSYNSGKSSKPKYRGKAPRRKVKKFRKSKSSSYNPTYTFLSKNKFSKRKSGGKNTNGKRKPFGKKSSKALGGARDQVSSGHSYYPFYGSSRQYVSRSGDSYGSYDYGHKEKCCCRNNFGIFAAIAAVAFLNNNNNNNNNGGRRRKRSAYYDEDITNYGLPFGFTGYGADYDEETRTSGEDTGYEAEYDDDGTTGYEEDHYDAINRVSQGYQDEYDENPSSRDSGLHDFPHHPVVHDTYHPVVHDVGYHDSGLHDTPHYPVVHESYHDSGYHDDGYHEVSYHDVGYHDDHHHKKCKCKSGHMDIMPLVAVAGLFLVQQLNNNNNNNGGRRRKRSAYYDEDINGGFIDHSSEIFSSDSNGSCRSGCGQCKSSYMDFMPLVAVAGLFLVQLLNNNDNGGGRKRRSVDSNGTSTDESQRSLSNNSNGSLDGHEDHGTGRSGCGCHDDNLGPLMALGFLFLLNQLNNNNNNNNGGRRRRRGADDDPDTKSDDGRRRRHTGFNDDTYGKLRERELFGMAAEHGLAVPARRCYL